MRKSVAWCPFINKFNTEAVIREVTDNDNSVEHLGKIVNSHHENAISDIPSVYVPFIVAVSIEHVHVVELRFDVLCP